MDSIETSGELNLSNVSFNIKEEETSKTNNAQIVGHRAIEQYQQSFEDWRSCQNHNSCDLYKKTDIVFIHQDEEPVKKEAGLLEIPLSEKEEVQDEHKKEIPQEIEKEELKGKEDVSSEDTIVPSNTQPKKPSIISSYFWSTVYTLGSGIYKAGAGVYNVNSFVTSNIKSIINVESKKPIVKEGLNPVQKEIYSYIVKFTRAEESECKQMVEVFKKLPEKMLNDILPILKTFEELSEKRISLLMQGKDFDEKDKDFFLKKNFFDDIFLQLTSLKSISKIEENEVRKFFEIVEENVKTFNSQIFGDNIALGYYPLSYAINDTGTFNRHLDNVNSFKDQHRLSDDPSMKYLVKNNFISRLSCPCSCYNSCSWEMEVGKDFGNERLFEKGYCKIELAIPNIDLREIRIPIDLRFLELNSMDELKIIFTMIKDVAGKNTKDRQEYLKRENLKNELLKGGKEFLLKCTKDKKFDQLTNMLDFVARYTNDTIEKGLISLGRKDIHFDGVVSLFEVFPRKMIENECGKNKEFKKAYNDFLIALHDVREGNIKNFLGSGSVSPVSRKAIEKYSSAMERMNTLLNDSSLTEQQRESINNYLNYLMEFSFSGWTDKSPLTHAETIKKILGDWKDLLKLNAWPKGMEYEITQMLSDPSTCRLVVDYIHFAKVAKEENFKLFKEKGEVPLYAFHNIKMRTMCSELFEAIGQRVEPLKKEKLMILMGKTLLDAYVKPPKDHIESAQNVVEMVRVWDEDKVSLVVDGKSEMLNLEQLKEKFFQNCLELSPEGLPEQEKTEIIEILKGSLQEIQSEEEMKNILDIVDQFKGMRKQGLIELGFHLVPRNRSLDCSIELFNRSQSSGPHIANALIYTFDRVGSAGNTQITNHSFPQSTFHPKYWIENKNQLGIKNNAGIRELNNWDSSSRGSSKENQRTPRECSAALIEMKYQLRGGSNYNYMKILWHMDEGYTIQNSEIRLFQSGNCEIIAAIPMLGDIRSCRVSIDLKPFKLKDKEAVLEVTEHISTIMDAVNQQERKERLAHLIENWKKQSKYDGIVQNADLFTSTILQFSEEMDQALTKVLNSVGDPHVHYGDVEELGDQIPYMMLQEKFSDNDEFQDVWKRYLAVAGQAINLQMESYLDEGSVDVKKMGSLMIDLELVEKKLLEQVKKGFDQEEDLKVIKNYLQKIKNLGSEPWSLKSNYQLKMMEKAATAAFDLQKNEKGSIKIVELKKLLFPMLIEGNLLGAFNDWLRALEVAQKSTKSSGYDYSDFPHQRLLTKEKDIQVLLLDRTDMSEQQKNAIANWMKQQFPK